MNTETQNNNVQHNRYLLDFWFNRTLNQKQQKDNHNTYCKYQLFLDLFPEDFKTILREVKNKEFWKSYEEYKNQNIMSNLEQNTFYDYMIKVEAGRN